MLKSCQLSILNFQFVLPLKVLSPDSIQIPDFFQNFKGTLTDEDISSRRRA